MFPEQAVRELVANAMIHQDLTAAGNRVMVEMYEDRLEVTTPGSPLIDVDRFIDDSKSRNVELAELMRHLGICEEKGSGIDKVVMQAELFQLPAPKFWSDDHRTISAIYAHRDFEDMSGSDRVRACYQHATLKFVIGSSLTNQSLRERFGLPATDTSKVSNVIREARDQELIKPVDAQATSQRYARYVPIWA